LLPTIRSRCLGHTMAWPDEETALAWLQGQGVAADDARTLLRAAGGRPDDALQFAQSGRDAKRWRLLPKALSRGEVSAFSDWSPQQAIDALQKICHDLLAVRTGAAPHFFDKADLPPGASLAALTRWSKALMASARTAEHPFNTGLMLETLVSQARNALNSRNQAAP
jgi:DNA polymerase-3 subunit delta'